MAYVGPPSTRRRLAEQLGLARNAGPIANKSKKAGGSGEGVRAERANVVVTSYSVLRTDGDVLAGQVGCRC